MKKFFYFMVVGLAFTALQVATVSAADTAAGLVSGADDHHTGEKCAALATAALRSECEERKSTHAERDHGGMAAGTTAMCGGVPCTTAGATTGGGTVVAKTIDDPSCTVAPEMRAADCPPMATGGGGDGGVALTIDDPKCVVAAAHRDPGCPNANMP